VINTSQAVELRPLLLELEEALHAVQEGEDEEEEEEEEQEVEKVVDKRGLVEKRFRVVCEQGFRDGIVVM